MKKMRRKTAMIVIILGTWICSETAAEAPPPDLYLEWIVGGRAVSDGPPLEGFAGQTVVLDYRIGNAGGRDAFAVIISAHTALGRVAPPNRVQPGPKAGARLDRTLTVALAEGMRELCLEIQLQNLSAEDPGDPEPKNNRRCRRVEVDSNRSDERTDIGDLSRKETQ